MFGTLTSLVQSATVGPPRKDVPPPTDITLPSCHPQLTGWGDRSIVPEASADSLVALFQTIHRPAQLEESYFRALGVHVHKYAPAEEIVPVPALLPQKSGWEDMTPDRAADLNKDFQQPLSNGNKSPEARIYAERRKELSADNQAAFRTLRRIKPEPGKQAVRLGGSYEFFKQMDLMAGYWDDTSLPPPPEENDADPHDSGHPRPATRIPHPIDGSLDQAAHALVAATTGSEQRRSHEPESSEGSSPERVVYRTAPGSQMPASYRHDMVGAFIKLVAYDFGCNISPSRVEPRLYLRTPTANDDASSSSSKVEEFSPRDSKKKQQATKDPITSHFPSGCTFIFRTPTTRDAARAGIVEGPVAAVSIRNTTSFTCPTDAKLDFGRELIAALVTAQLRARENKTEQRIGEGKWWATAKRWGGGVGGPIGREIDNDVIQGDKDAPEGNGHGNGHGNGGSKHNGSSRRAGGSSSSSSSKGSRPSRIRSPASSSSPSSSSTSFPTGPTPPSTSTSSSSSSYSSSAHGQPAGKRARKTLSIYDNYRMVRKPASNWDKKARYQAIGKQAGADYDDIFVFSSLFHHFSVLRVRVPRRLLTILDGDIAFPSSSSSSSSPSGQASLDPRGNNEQQQQQKQQQRSNGEHSAEKGRDWGKVEIWRSKWFDLFVVEDRLEAMRLLWGVMMWVMRKTAGADAAAATAAAAGEESGSGSNAKEGGAEAMKLKAEGGGEGGAGSDGDLVMRDV